MFAFPNLAYTRPFLERRHQAVELNEQHAPHKCSKGRGGLNGLGVPRQSWPFSYTSCRYRENPMVPV